MVDRGPGRTAAAASRWFRPKSVRRSGVPRPLARRAAILQGTVLLVFAVLATSCTTGAETVLPADEQVSETAETPADEPNTTEVVAVDPVPSILASLTVEQKVGQLLMPMVWGTSTQTTDDERRLNLEAHGYETAAEIVDAYDLGGVVYLAANVSSAADLRSMSGLLQATAV
ncbi:MAG: hypothetical protein AAF531_21365, partial [Actinomycetota bacterium]